MIYTAPERTENEAGKKVWGFTHDQAREAAQAILKGVDDEKVLGKFDHDLHSHLVEDDKGTHHLATCCSCGEWSMDWEWRPRAGVLRILDCDLYATKTNHQGDKVITCTSCWKSIHDKNVAPPMCQKHVPALGDIPDVLKDLWYMERHVISRQQAVISIITLKGGGQGGSKGHSIILDNPNAANMLCTLPVAPDPNDVVVVTLEGCKKKLALKNRRIRPARVREALLWLQEHHLHYRDIAIDEILLHQWEAATDADGAVDVMPNMDLSPAASVQATSIGHSHGWFPECIST